MASDSQIELFAYDAWSHLWWSVYREEKVAQRNEFRNKYPDECHQINDYLEVRDDLLNLIIFRFFVFLKIYIKELTSEKIKSLKSLSDFYEFVTHSCDREDLFGNLTFFERMYSTLGFVLVICLCMTKNVANTLDLANYSHIFWAMYFDKYTSKFYEKGGWRQLKREIDCYKFLSDFDKSIPKFKNLTLPDLKQATVNYIRFKKCITVHTSKSWIQFQIKYFENYINIPLSYESCLQAYEVELLIKDLKQILCPKRCNSNHSNVSKESFKYNIYATEIHRAIEMIEANVHNTKFKPLIFNHEKTIDLYSNRCGSNHSRVSEEQFKYKIYATEIHRAIEMVEVDVHNMKFKPLILDRKKTINKVSDKFLNDEQVKIIKLKDDLSSSQMTEPRRNAKTTPENHLILKDCSVKENSNIDDIMRRRNEARKELRKEQENPEINIFLRMLLVLGDKNGTEFVFSELQTRKERPGNTQERSNKRKKKNRKK